MSQDQPFAHDRYLLSAELELRSLQPADAGLLASRLASMEPWQSLGFTVASLERYLTRHDPGLYRYRILRTDVLAGVVAVREPWLRGACLELLGLFAECQGKGLGQQILAWLVAEVSIRTQNLWTTVSETNHQARRFYAKQGFIPIADIPDLIQRGSSETLLRLPLSGVKPVSS